MGDRFAIGKEDLSRLQQMYDRFMKLGLKILAGELPSNSPVESIARARTMTVLHRLDPNRRGSLIQLQNDPRGHGLPAIQPYFRR